MESSFFFIQVEKNEQNSQFLNDLEHYSEANKRQVYVIDRPLTDKRYEYECPGRLIVLIPNCKILLINFGASQEQFSYFEEDFIEDLGSISDKFRYKETIGRPRDWKGLIERIDDIDLNESIDGFLAGHRIEDLQDQRRCELLISLLIGSINDIERIRLDASDNVLDRVKHKIILFDGDQTRFIYKKLNQKIITIQGLSGTGKTELLLHKLRELYTETEKNKIIFTCHNKILADSLRERIPEFFDFMKVEEQILWNKRLWCVHAWGSQRNQDSGAYTYICHYYNLKFHPYGKTFEQVCQLALEELRFKDIGQYGHAFDYMLVDESQDFPKAFIDLCKAVTKKKIYVAGDIFQSIFDQIPINEIEPDYLLSKCYRTDPKTLMFAHAIGMGLFEKPKLRWLEDREWKACGYLVEKINDERTYELSREPLRRFEDLQYENVNSVKIIRTSQIKGENAESKIIEVLKEIKDEHPTVAPGDIGIIFIDSKKISYLYADRLQQSIPREFGWKINKAYETKVSLKDQLFVSNKNNVKGLEFPFVICVTKEIKTNLSYRNSLYMMLTRSFIKSYLLTSEDENQELLEELEAGLETIKTEGVLRVEVPSNDEKEAIRTRINYENRNESYYDLTERIFEDLSIPSALRDRLREITSKILGENYDYESVLEAISQNYRLIRKGQNSEE
jgi:superfamily I DNA and RNA helicase